MKYLIILLLLGVFSLSINAQTSKKSVKKIIPKSYSTTTTKSKGIATPPEKRILKINLDSLLLNNNVTIREIIKGDSTNTVIDYTINVYQMPNPRDSVQISNMQGNLYLRITEIKKDKFAKYKQVESDRMNKEIEDIDRKKAAKIKERDDLRKQN
jgi:hypothetical protein